MAVVDSWCVASILLVAALPTACYSDAICGAAGMPTTRSHAQEETYSSSEEADRGSDSENSEPDESSPASSADKADSQVCKRH